MASEETKQAVEATESEQPTDTENNMNTTSAQPAAETESDTTAAAAEQTVNAETAVIDNSDNTESQAETSQDVAVETDVNPVAASADNVEADAETSAPAIQTENESVTEIELASPASFETEATAPEIAALDEVHSESVEESPAATDSTPETAMVASPGETSAQAESADKPKETDDALESTSAIEPEHQAKKENVVVKKLKLNPNAKAPAPLPPAAQNASAPDANAPATENKSAQSAPAAKPATASNRAPGSAPKTDEPEAESMDFGSILEMFEQEQQEQLAKYREGTLVEGTVVSISERGVMIDFGYKAEGVVNTAEYMQDGQLNVNVGDPTEVVVKRLDNGEGLPELSRAEAVKVRTWDELEKASQDGTPIKGRVIDKIKGGLSVDINGIEAFLPGSQIDSRPPRSLDGFKGQEIEARVIKFSRKRGNIVLSRKVLLDEVTNVQKTETLSNLAEGYIVEGNVKSLTDYGAFVDLGGIDGLLHVTDMSWGKLDRQSDMLRPGDDVQVKVLKIDREKERISLGLKQLIPNPWSSVAERYEIGSKHMGKVSSTTDYGAFVELEPGVEGLVHVSEMTWSKRAKHPNKIVRPGQEIEVQVLRIDQKDRRVSLGMRQVMTNPWETIYERYPVGTQVTGRVRNMTDFGAFVELEEGVDGLVHLSDITHSKKLKHPSEVLKKNQEVEAIVTGINVEGRRMSLSMKDLQPSTWDQFVSEHKPGDVVRGKISRFANFGVFVELGEDLEGLCHISELSDERIEKPEKVFEIGQEMEFKILRIEPDVQKIGLSHRAVGKEDEPIMDTKTYSTEAKSGMASLGELANLRNLRDSGEENQN
ncbi:MAG: 30S ribosomal protein S1 [Pyrinomonadaceae bacterium]